MQLGRKSTSQRVIDALDQSLKVAQDVRPALDHLVSATRGKSTGQRIVDSVTSSFSSATPKISQLGSPKARKAGLIAAGSLAGLTVGSAGISSLRRKSERTEDDS